MNSDRKRKEGTEKRTQENTKTQEKPKYPNIDQADFKVHVFWDEKKCEEFLAKGEWPKKGTVLLGFDAEYTAERDVAMIQMSDEDTVVIVKLAYVNPKDHADKKILPVPAGVRKILEGSEYIKAGVGVLGDAQALLTQYSDLVMDGLLDVSALALGAGITTSTMSLGNLSQDILGIPKGKSCGCWAYRYMLTPEQAKYAGYDAWTSLRVAQELFRTLMNDNEGVREWCLRAIKIAEPYTEEHVYDKDMNETVYVDGVKSNAVRNGSSAPQRVRDRTAEKKKMMSMSGTVKDKLNDFRRKRDKYKSEERAIDDALNALKDSSHSSHSSSQPPTKKKQKSELSSYLDEDDGMQMNFF